MKNRWYNILCGYAVARLCSYAIVAAGLIACTDELGTSGEGAIDANYINIGGINADELLEVSSPDATLMTRAGGDDGGSTPTPTPDANRQKAEDVVWLQNALKAGLDITYSNMDADMKHVVANEKVAVLKWLGTKSAAGRGDYSFYYKGTTQGTGVNETGDPAIWYSNGPHYFEGVHVPADIRTTGSSITAQNIIRDQSNVDNENYTLLSHYIGMPPSWHHNATIDQVLLPFKHRLSRVIVYVLIDPALNTKIKGYKQDVTEDDWDTTEDDPNTTSLRFNKVKVLDHVQEVDATETSSADKLTPIWTNDEHTTNRKVIPHFVGETSQCIKADGTTLAATDDDAKEWFIVYTEKATQDKIHPREKKWAEAHAKYRAAAATSATGNGESSGYIQSKYQKVPVYDVIVRPTYTEPDSVMYDEDGYYTTDAGGVKIKNLATINQLVAETNSIDFEMTLESGLTYEKHFDFDLNANWQTVVYLTIDREGVDYDASTSEKWQNVLSNDGYYGPNNDLGHNLSMAGSSWQRAYRNGTLNVNVTDGNQYTEKDNLGQYVTDAAWIEHFAQAYKGGANHGDYFVLDKDITIDASQLPQNFVFTGHLDGRGYTITFTGSSDGWAESTLYNEEHLYNTKNESDEFHLPDLYIPNEIAQAKPRKAGIDKGDDMMTKVTDKSLYEIMTDKVDYYFYDDEDGKYKIYNRPAALYRKNPACLFAGLDAEYKTAQESNPSLDYKLWEANVHMETNNGKTYWVPFPGYRAEILNTKLTGGSFFPYALPNNAVTGYIYNCFEGTTLGTPISNNPSSIPEY